MLYLSDEDVVRHAPLEEVISAVEEAFKYFSLGVTVTPLRTRVEAREYRGDILLMPCYMPAMNVFSTKIVTVYPENMARGLPTIQASVVAVNPSNGSIMFVASARALTGMRTGAATAVSFKYLGRKDSQVLGLIGCGYQAGWQLRALSKVAKLEEVMVYDIDGERMEKFAREMGGETGLPVKPVREPEKLVHGSDIVVTATTSRTPVVLKGWVKPGTHISAIGAYTPDMAELDPELVASSKLVVDSREAALEEAGDIIQAIRKGLMAKEKIYAELGELAAGLKPGRTGVEEITIFKSVGLAVQDAAVVKVLADHLTTR
ncbi:Delta(1)-pyrroline-2-carboxylate reductase [archaeon HR01]|nr:Delta(1)-pyrroline-2-carboxylate reductase [archaeon HR01]